jgi:hypothetical protein
MEGRIKRLNLLFSEDFLRNCFLLLDADKNNCISLDEFLKVLEYPYRRNILYWNIPTDGTFCAGISLWVLTEYFVLECPYRLNMFIPTDGIFCTGMSLRTEHFVLE